MADKQKIITDRINHLNLEIISSVIWFFVFLIIGIFTLPLGLICILIAIFIAHSNESKLKEKTELLIKLDEVKNGRN